VVAQAREDAVSFGPFSLLPIRRVLLEANKPVHVGSRALDILITLVERPGEVISKEELMARVWPDTFVEEGNLRVHISALRRALGDGQLGTRYVANIPGRGYRFVAPILPSEGPSVAPPAPSAAAGTRAHLPTSLTRMIGRSEVVRSLSAQLPRSRMITVVGPGGVGKTTVALAIAHELLASFRDGVRFLDIGPISDPSLVQGAVASAFGLEVTAEAPMSKLLAFLRDKQMLLVFDSCEHAIDAAAVTAAEILGRAPGVCILATSREPLRAPLERVHRLSPLQVPDASPGITAAQAIAFPAVQLFVERAMASLDTFELTDAEAPAVAEICRRLDGIALAIELAAGRVGVFGAAGLAAHLDDRFRLLTSGLRTALPRHQTLRATLDWSYEFLSESERRVLRALAIFIGRFTLDAAMMVSAGTGLGETEIVTCIADLVAKSLLTADVAGANVEYRLLDTTRSYTLGKLKEAQEHDRFARGHAECFRDLLDCAGEEWETQPTTEWLATYAHHIDNVRAALDWASSESGDDAIFVTLAIAAVPLWLQLSLLDECQVRVEQAIGRLGPETAGHSRQRMRLTAALAVALTHKSGPGPQIKAAWTSVLETAESMDDRDYRLRALWGLWVDSINGGEYQRALAFARKFSDTASELPGTPEQSLADRLVGNSLFYLGQHGKARTYIERMLHSYVAPTRGSHVVRYQFDQRVAAGAILARIVWAQGFPEQALRVAHESLDRARAIDHALSINISLSVGMCQVALMVGALDLAEHTIAMLVDYTTRHAFSYWLAWSHAFKGVLLIKRGDLAGGLDILGEALEERGAGAKFARYHLPFLGEFAECLGSVGDTARALAVVDETLERCERGDARWYFAELTRIKGEIALREGTPEAAEAHFLNSLKWAREQETLSWELRAATSLARLWRDQNRREEARRLLAPVYRRFKEGLDTADVTAARSLLEGLS
jgi:predicted ATPase/DNA-binding winged helix-turn-helix (wHTH) protein